MSTGTELQVANTTNHQAFLTKKTEDMDKWILPSAGIRADALVRHALHEISMSGELQQCTPPSIYLALLACAVTGLVPGKMRGYSFLIPFKNTKKIVDDKGNGKEITLHEATFMVGWKGVKHCAFRAGLDLVGDVVHERDDFAFDKGTAKFIRHSPALKQRGEMIGAYAYAELPRKGLEIEWLDMEELHKIELFAKSKGGGKSPAWDGPFANQMRRKSALRRLGKQLEMGEDFHRAELLENGRDDGSLSGALDYITDGAASKALGEQSVEAAAFGGAPRPAQVQVPREDVHAIGVKGPVGTRAKPIDAKSTERPTTAPAGASPSPNTSTGSSPSTESTPSSTPSNSTSKLDEAKAKAAAADDARKLAALAKEQAAAAGVTGPTVAPSASTTGPSASTGSVSPGSTTGTSSSADGDPFPADFGEDPVDVEPKSIETFNRWAASCRNQKEMLAGKTEWISWSKSPEGQPFAGAMRDAYAKRWADLSGVA